MTHAPLPKRALRTLIFLCAFSILSTPTSMWGQSTPAPGGVPAAAPGAGATAVPEPQPINLRIMDSIDFGSGSRPGARDKDLIREIRCEELTSAKGPSTPCGFKRPSTVATWFEGTVDIRKKTYHLTFIVDRQIEDSPSEPAPAPEKTITAKVKTSNGKKMVRTESPRTYHVETYAYEGTLVLSPELTREDKERRELTEARELQRNDPRLSMFRIQLEQSQLPADCEELVTYRLYMKPVAERDPVRLAQQTESGLVALKKLVLLDLILSMKEPCISH